MSLVYRVSAAVLALITYELYLLALPRATAVTVDNVTVTLVSAGAAVACGWFAVTRRGWERQWRALAAACLAATSIGQGVWTAYQVSGRPEPASLSWPDLAFLVTVLIAIGGLVFIARNVSTSLSPHGRLQELRLVVDGLLVSGSIFLLAWMTTLGSVSMASVLAFWVPAAEVLLITLVLLIYTTRQIPRENLRHLSLIGGGITVTALSDIAFSSYLNGSLEQYPFVAGAGFLAGPVLVAAAAAMPDFVPARPSAHQAPAEVAWPAVAAPYLPLAVVTVFLSAKVLAGTTLSTFEAVGAVSIFTLVAVRQVLTLGRAPAIGVVRPEEQTDREVPDETEFDRKMRAYVLFLRDEHRLQLDRLQRAGNRTALWTLLGGAVLGVLGNVVVAVFLG